MRVSRVVVLVIDRLGAAWLGPYGNTWLDTPNFNRLAAQSLLFETAISDSPELGPFCRSLWTGRHAMSPHASHSGASVHLLPALAQAAGGRTCLLTDDPQIAANEFAVHFQSRRLLEAPEAREPASDLEDTAFLRFFREAQTALEQFDGPGLVVLHSRGMAAAWDAPMEMRLQFADELDPDPPTFVEPPNRRVPRDHDPDEILGIAQAFAGQVALADMCLGPFLDAFEAHPLAADSLLVVTSPRGFPLAEHQRLGPCDHALYGELLHVPLLLRAPSLDATRVQRLIQPHGLSRLIAGSCGWSQHFSSSDQDTPHDLLSHAQTNVAYCLRQRERAIRTPAWFLREHAEEGAVRHELFAKPDDRWEANEVSSRCGDVVELLAAELERFQNAAAAGQEALPAPLPDVLCNLWR